MIFRCICPKPPRSHSHVSVSPAYKPPFHYFLLLIFGGLFLVLSGLTITAAVLGLIFFGQSSYCPHHFGFPSRPSFVAGFLSLSAFGHTAFAALSWLYCYFRGLHLPGSERIELARSRIFNTAREVKVYTRDYSGHLHGKVKDAAPGRCLIDWLVRLRRFLE